MIIYMSRQGKKKITTWSYSRNGICLEIAVYMHTGERQIRKKYVTTWFGVTVPEYEISDFDTNVDSLKKRVFSQIEKRGTIEWKNVLWVSFEHERERLFDKRKRSDTPNTNREASSKLTLDWGRMQMAEKHGHKIYRLFHYYHEGTLDPDSDEPITDAREVYQGINSVYGYQKKIVIPDTAENREALEMVADIIEAAGEKLNVLLNKNSADAVKALLSLRSKNLIALPE